MFGDPEVKGDITEHRDIVSCVRPQAAAINSNYVLHTIQSTNQQIQFYLEDLFCKIVFILWKPDENAAYPCSHLAISLTHVGQLVTVLGQMSVMGSCFVCTAIDHLTAALHCHSLGPVGLVRAQSSIHYSATYTHTHRHKRVTVCRGSRF